MRVWDSSFQPVFTLQQDGYTLGNSGLVFASNDLLMSSGSASNKLYWYHISKPNVMSVFLEADVLPFCRDVMNIIVAYLPFVTHVTHHTHPNTVRAVTALSSELMVSSCDDHMLRFYAVHDNSTKPQVIACTPYEWTDELVSCPYPCADDKTGFVLASSVDARIDISLIFSQVCILRTVYFPAS